MVLSGFQAEKMIPDVMRHPEGFGKIDPDCENLRDVLCKVRLLNKR
jgi:hypothetical protein